MASLKKKKAEPVSNEKLKALLNPITAKNAVGPYIRYDNIFDEIVTQRTQEDATLPQGIWKRDLKQANWLQVAKLCEAFISKHSKDLQIAAWLMQAWYYTKGLKGLTQGLLLFNQLCTTYWANIHPHSHDVEETQEDRCNLVDWINEKLTQDLHCIPVTKPENAKLAGFTFEDVLLFDSNQTLPANSDRTALFQQYKDETPTSFYQALITDTTAAIAEINNLDHTLDNNLGENTFSLSQLRKTLQSIQEYAQKQCDARVKQLQKPKPSVTPVQDKAITKAPPKTNKKPIKTDLETKENNCEFLYDQLRKIAQEIEKIHPHSPAPYLIQKAILVDQKSLQEWLGDIESYNLEALSLQKWMGI